MTDPGVVMRHAVASAVTELIDGLPRDGNKVVFNRERGETIGIFVMDLRPGL